MSYVKIDVQNKIATVTMAHAPANALTDDMYIDLTHAFYELGEREDVAIIVLRAEGKIFCGGNDTGAFSCFDTRTAAEEAALRCADMCSAIWGGKKPVIAAVQGACMGAGWAMAAVCDFIIAGEGVKFGMPEINLGIPAAGVFTKMCLPMHMAKYYSFTGDPILAEDLHRWGCVMKVVPKDQVWAEADAFAQRIASSCYRALACFHQNFNQNMELHIRDQFLVEQHSFMDNMLGSHDFKEAIDAHNEKRKPVFNGK